MRKSRVLIVDDLKDIRKSTGIALEKTGYFVDTAGTCEEALSKLDRTQFDALVLDLCLPDGDGMDILQKLGREGSDIVVIIVTAFGSIDSAVEAVKSGAYHYIVKPIDFDHLRQLLKGALEKKRLTEENRVLKAALREDNQFSGIVFSSKSMLDVVETVKIAAQSDNNVLIVGETGTGKEKVADAVHYNSSRKDHIFIKTNCATLTESLLEDELFGHEKGAFTDAKDKKKGLFELADGGSVQFDEIGCMSPSMQARLLRVIEDKNIKRVGGTESFNVDVRIIASTNENLEQAIASGAFRADLYYRLNVVKIEIPPLRKRKEDVPVLLRHFIDKHSKKDKGKDIKIEAVAMEALLEHDWPGNIRELENIVQRALMYDIKGMLRLEHFPKDFCGNGKRQTPLEIPEEGIKFVDFTRELLVQTLKKTGGNKTKAAEMLGVSRRFLRAHLEDEDEKT